jgi:phosphate transport system substrate-binding protein
MMRTRLLALLLGPFLFLQELHPVDPPSVTIVETAVPPGDPVRGPLTFSTSGVMGALVGKTRDAFIQIHKNVDSRIIFPSSNTVLKALLEQNLALGGMSRPMTGEEKSAFEEKYGYPAVELTVALDALRIVVHGDNPLSEITMAQLNRIYAEIPKGGGFSGIGNWSELGLTGNWVGEPIISYGGAKGWGTTLTFEALIMDGGPSHKDIEVKSIEDIPAQIAKDKLGLGYTSLGPPLENVKVLDVGDSEQGTFIAPTLENVASGAYPLCRRFYFYLNANPKEPVNPVIRAYLEFVFSDAGQELIGETGAVPLSPKDLAIQRGRVKSLP